MGELVSTPKEIILNTPVSKQVEKLTLRFNFSATTPKADITYNIVDDNGKVFASHEVVVSGSGLADFLAGIATTLNSRAEAAIWADIQGKYTTQDIT